jgi:hypothetical protein
VGTGPVGELMNQFCKSIAAGILAVSLFFSVAGCGGSDSGASTSGASATLTRQVAKAIETGFMAKSMSYTGTKSRSATRNTEPQFDEFFELWFTTEGTTTLYTLDQAGTQPAGQTLRTSTIVEGTVTNTEVTTITAGPKSGYSQSLTLSISAGEINFDQSGTSTETGPFKITGKIVESTGIVTVRSEFKDEAGADRFYDITVQADGAATVSYNNNQLFTYQLNYAADQSGQGTVSGNSPLLPASLTWNTQGDGVLTFADGTSLNFTGFDFNTIP